MFFLLISKVSTRSRPKAAGTSRLHILDFYHSFNTQPPEGGWFEQFRNAQFPIVSTRSRPKAAGHSSF